MKREELSCVNCGEVLGVVELEGDDYDRPVSTDDDGAIHFISWEVGASVRPFCTECGNDE